MATKDDNSAVNASLENKTANAAKKGIAKASAKASAKTANQAAKKPVKKATKAPAKKAAKAVARKSTVKSANIIPEEPAATAATLAETIPMGGKKLVAESSAAALDASIAESAKSPMAVSEPKDTVSDALYESLGITRITHFDRARESSFPQTRLAEVRKAALKLREEMLNGKQASYYRTTSLVRVPYPTKYGLLNAATVATPFMHILNRLFVVRFNTAEGLKTLLFSPSDIEGNRETPFFKNLSDKAGNFSDLVDRFLAPVLSSVEQALATMGLKPEDIDFISYDHLHTQDIRKWLGSGNRPGYFPNAKLLVMKQEWCSTQSLLPPQAYWYCPNGIKGIPEDRVVLLDSSVMLGDGVALVQTPGHTEGNHSLVVNTPDGLLVSSENGVSADNYSPLSSKIPGVRQYAQQTGMEVILNGNTLEGGLDQYVSMVLEKTLAGPARNNPEFFNVVPSSELTAYWGFPGLKPSFSFGEIEHGKI